MNPEQKDNHTIESLNINSEKNQDIFWKQLSTELIKSYNKLWKIDIQTIENTFNTIIKNTESKNDLKNITILLEQLPYTDPKDINLFYKLLWEQFNNNDEFACFTLDPLWYINNQTGCIKDNISIIKIEEEKRNIEKEKRNIEEEKRNIEEEKRNIEEENDNITQANIKEINRIYDSNSDAIRNLSLPKDFKKSDIINKLPTEKLDILKKAFWYTFDIKDIVLPDGTKKVNYDAWMMNDSVEYKISTFVYYYAELNDKIKQSAQPNSKIKITEQERQQVQEFGNMLESLWVNTDDLYNSLDVRYQAPKEDKNSTSWKKKREWWLELKPQLEDKNTSYNNKPKENSLWNLSDSFEKMDSDDMNISPLFVDQYNNPKPWFDNISLLKSFPLPKWKTLFDFKAENIGKKPRIINSILRDEKSHPLISTSTTDKQREQRAKKSMIIKLLFDANPSRKEIPLQLAKRLFPINESTDGKQKIPDIRWKDRIEKDLIIPLMRNNFCDNNQEKSITKEIKKWYMTYLNNLMLTTPALQDFECKPEDIVLKNEKVTLPLSLKWQKEINSYLTVDHGNIYLTNTLYNPTDSDPNSISKWKVLLWNMDDFKDFSDKITTHITPEIIQKSLSDNNPRTQYSEQIQEIITDQITNSSKDLSSTKAGIAHGLAWSKAQDGVFNIIKNWHKDNLNTDSNNTIDAQSPFYSILRDYTKDPAQKITKENNKDLFDSLSLSKNTILRNSAQENEKFSTDINNLQDLLINSEFNERLQNYLNTKPNDEFSSQKQNILQILSSTNRTKSESIALFLKLFWTNPEKWKESINSLDVNKFHNFIQQLVQVKDFNIINMNDIISSRNPTLASIEEKYAPSADDNLESALDNIDDTNTIEIIKE
jgi:hypothetical protein